MAHAGMSFSAWQVLDLLDEMDRLRQELAQAQAEQARLNWLARSLEEECNRERLGRLDGEVKIRKLSRSQT